MARGISTAQLAPLIIHVCTWFNTLFIGHWLTFTCITLVILFINSSGGVEKYYCQEHFPILLYIETKTVICLQKITELLKPIRQGYYWKYMARRWWTCQRNVWDNTILNPNVQVQWRIQEKWKGGSKLRAHSTKFFGVTPTSGYTWLGEIAYSARGSPIIDPA